MLNHGRIAACYFFLIGVATYTLVAAYHMLIIIPPNAYDHPIALLSAMRITSNSEVPYRDFFVLYGPWAHHGLALSIAKSPLQPLETATLYYFVLALLNIGMLSLIFRTFHKNERSVFAELLFLALISPLMFGLSYYSGQGVLLLLAGCFLMRTTSHSALAFRPAFLAPTLLAGSVIVAIFVRLNFGFYLGLASIVGLGAIAVIKKNQVQIIIFIFSCATFILMALGSLFLNGSLPAYLIETIQYLMHFKNRIIPPSIALADGTMAVSFCIFVLGFCVFTTSTLAFRKINQATGYYLFLAVLAFCLTSNALNRYDIEHVYPLAVIMPLLALAVFEVDSRPGVSARALTGMALTVIFLLTISYEKHRDIILSIPNLIRSSFAQIDYRLRTVQYRLGTNETSLIEFLRERKHEGQKILLASYPGSCECTTDFCFSPSVYYSLAQLPSTYYWIMDTPLTIRFHVQERLIQETNSVEFVVLQEFERLSACVVANSPKEPHLFGQHVREHFKFIAKISNENSPYKYHVFRRKIE